MNELKSIDDTESCNNDVYCFTNSNSFFFKCSKIHGSLYSDVFSKKIPVFQTFHDSFSIQKIFIIPKPLQKFRDNYIPSNNPIIYQFIIKNIGM